MIPRALVPWGSLRPRPRPVPNDGPLVDGWGRRVDALRLSLTDRCNLRCVYCLPVEGVRWLPKADLLTDEEIVAVVRQLAALGLRRLRLTGGEPLLRPNLLRLVERLRAIPGVEELALSTNGTRLAPLAPALRNAGVDRVNLSLDSLRPERLDAMARRPGVGRAILAGLEAAAAAGFDPLKINCVVLRGLNDDELEDFAALSAQHPWHVRFLELMPVGGNLALSDRFVSADEVLVRLRRLGPLAPVPGPPGWGPARCFAFPGAPGTVGVISPLSHSFCTDCRRLRLTADGRLRPCLFGTVEVDLRTPLRRGEPLEPYVRRALALKPEGHRLVLGRADGSGGWTALSQIGG
jgi:cyclic pyranopterin phosphate synthase